MCSCSGSFLASFCDQETKQETKNGMNMGPTGSRVTLNDPNNYLIAKLMEYYSSPESKLALALKQWSSQQEKPLNTIWQYILGY